MIDKLAGLPTQIRQLEKRLKEMDASKVKPALVKEITDTIKNLKDMLKEKMDKREERKKAKEVAAVPSPAEVEKEAIAVPNAADIGAVSQNAPSPAAAPGAPAATPDDQKVSCPLCGGITFNDNASYQQHMEYTHASDIMPTTPGQKLDKTVASVEEPPVEKQPEFKLDAEVKPVRTPNGESTGKVMRWDGKPNSLVYVMWEKGPLKDRDGFGGYEPLDLQLVEQKPVEAAIPMEKPACADCMSMKQKHGDLKSNYDSFLKDLKEERDIHYTQGNQKWVDRIEEKIKKLQEDMAQKFDGVESESCSACAQKKQSAPALKCDNCQVPMSTADQSHLENLPNGDQKWNCNEKTADSRCSDTSGTSHAGPLVKMFSGSNTPIMYCDKHVPNEKKKEAGAQNAEELTIMDHTPPRANSGPDDGGKDTHDEFQDEWAMPVTAATKLSIFNKEFVATPINDQKKFAGYEISQNGKKLFKINSKNSQPMSKEQLGFCTQVELTRGLKQAKLTTKIAFLEEGSKVYVLAQDKAGKRIKFASMEHGIRGWAPVSKFAFLAKEAEMRKHKDHIDNTYGNNGKEILVDCPNGSGNIVWLPMGELLPLQQPPATPESLNDLESAQSYKPGTKARISGGSGIDSDKIVTIVDRSLVKTDGRGIPTNVAGAYKPVDWNREVAFQYEDGSIGTMFKNRLMPVEQNLEAAKDCEFCAGYGKARTKSGALEICPYCKGKGTKEEKHSAKECPDCHGTFQGNEGETCPTCGRFSVHKEALRPALPPQILNRRQEVNASGCDSCAASMINGVFCHETGCPKARKEREQEDFENSDEALFSEGSLNKKATVTHREDGWHVLSEKGKNLGGPYKTKGEATKRLREVEYFKHQGVFRPFSKHVYADALTDHVTEVRNNIEQVQQRLQEVPAVKTADVITDETVEETTNDPNAINPSLTTIPPATDGIKNIQPTDNDNLEIPVPMPTSPPSPGQKWVFDSVNKVYVSMPDTNDPSKLV